MASIAHRTTTYEVCEKAHWISVDVIGDSLEARLLRNQDSHQTWASFHVCKLYDKGAVWPYSWLTLKCNVQMSCEVLGNRSSVLGHPEVGPLSENASCVLQYSLKRSVRQSPAEKTLTKAEVNGDSQNVTRVRNSLACDWTNAGLVISAE